MISTRLELDLPFFKRKFAVALADRRPPVDTKVPLKCNRTFRLARPLLELYDKDRTVPTGPHRPIGKPNRTRFH